MMEKMTKYMLRATEEWSDPQSLESSRTRVTSIS